MFVLEILIGARVPVDDLISFRVNNSQISRYMQELPLCELENIVQFREMAGLNHPVGFI